MLRGEGEGGEGGRRQLEREKGAARTSVGSLFETHREERARWKAAARPPRNHPRGGGVLENGRKERARRKAASSTATGREGTLEGGLSTRKRWPHVRPCGPFSKPTGKRGHAGKRPLDPRETIPGGVEFSKTAGTSGHAGNVHL